MQRKLGVVVALILFGAALALPASASAYTLSMRAAKSAANDVAYNHFADEQRWVEELQDGHAFAFDFRLEGCYRTGGRTVRCRVGYLINATTDFEWQGNEWYCYERLRVFRRTRRSRVTPHLTSGPSCRPTDGLGWPL
jgi:hypothetical protein